MVVAHPGRKEENGNGAKPLPARRYVKLISKRLKRGRVVIVVAPTGTGKSTVIPRGLQRKLGQIIPEARADAKVIVTQPRRLAAAALAQWVSSQMGEEVGGTVGYWTGDSRQTKKSEKSRLIYVTDGLQLVREQLQLANDHAILIIDEVHEWNLAIETLIPWVKRRLEQGAKFKLVIMSATLDSEALSVYFGGAPVVHIPGKMYDVAERPRGESPEGDIATLTREGKNTLVFLPGKGEIREMAEKLRRMNVDAEILPLHSELSPQEQEKVFEHYERPKVVLATNIAQTSITIDDIDAVVDLGLVRHLRAFRGVDGLYTVPISEADRIQRKGRAGRCRPGVYIWWGPEGALRRFPEAEIERLTLETALLRIKASGVKFEELDFFHRPDSKQVRNALRALQRLDCLTLEGNVSEVGREIASMPVSVKIGRMIVEARKLGIGEDGILLGSIIEAGGVTTRGNTEWQKEFCPNENGSDCLAQLLAFKAVEKLLEHTEGDPEKRALQLEYLEEIGINYRNFLRAQNTREKLLRNFSFAHSRRLKPKEWRRRMSEAITAGFKDHVYCHVGTQWFNYDSQPRRILGSSVVSNEASFVVGIPFDVDLENAEEGPDTDRIILWPHEIPQDMESVLVPKFIRELRQEASRRTGKNGKNRRRKKETIRRGAGREARGRRGGGH